MSMTEAQLLAELATIPGVLSVSATPRIATVEDDKYETKLTVEVMWTGLSEENKRQIELTQAIKYSVYKRGQVGLESAYYEEDEPKNPVARDIAAVNGEFISYEKIFNNSVLRDRLLGWLIKTAGTTLITVYDNTSALPSTPAVNDQYVAKVTANGWTAAHKYKWNGSSWVDGGVWTKKNKWANDAFKKPETYLETVMMLISQDPTVRTKGGTATDADMAWLAYMIGGICDIHGFTD